MMTFTLPDGQIIEAGQPCVYKDQERSGLWLGSLSEAELEAEGIVVHLLPLVVPAQGALTMPTLDDAAGPAPVSQTITPDDVHAEYDRRIVATLGSAVRRESMLREVGAMHTIILSQQPLTAEQQADSMMLMAINVWETAMVAKREEILSVGVKTPAVFATAFIDATWPTPPPGLSEFRKGY